MRRLNQLGAERARMAARTSGTTPLHDATVDERTASYLDDQIEKEVCSLLEISGLLPE
jgi:hypothetical protein